MAEWWNRYTQQTQNLPHLCACEFDSRPRYQLRKNDMLDYIEAIVSVVVLMGLAVWFYMEKR